MLRIAAALLVALALSPALRAQIILPNQGETLPTFDVATVKPSSRDLGPSFHVHVWWSDNSYRTENTTLRDLIRAAFSISPAQLTGSDAQLDARWDINAKIGDDEFARIQKLPSDGRGRALRLMLQALLEDRFGLKVHTETRELPVFDLVIDKGGFKLQPIDPNAATAPARSDSTSTNVHHYSGRMFAPHAPVAVLLNMLMSQPELDGRMVIDKTGLSGRYDWTIEWQRQRLTPVASLDDNGPSLFTALKEQLGLKLESSKGPVQIVVVDAVSAPTPN